MARTRTMERKKAEKEKAAAQKPSQKTSRKQPVAATTTTKAGKVVKPGQLIKAGTDKAMPVYAKHPDPTKRKYHKRGSKYNITPGRSIPKLIYILVRALTEIKY